MAASPASSSRRSAGSSATSLKRSNDNDNSNSQHHSSDSLPNIPLDALVNHLLAAKRSLASMNHVLRANELVHSARNAYEDTAVLAAQTGFLRNSIVDQATILVRVRRNLGASYDWGKRDFKKLVRSMDEVGDALGQTMEMLRATEVQSALRPKGEERKNLMDFVDEDSVHGLRNALKRSIEELRGIQQSFDGDLLRFDDDIRQLRKILNGDSQQRRSSSESQVDSTPMMERLEVLVDHSSNMAQLLASLTNHFDMCVTAVRTTEGGAALARRKAAEAAGPDGVSISGIIAEQESNLSDLEPKTAKDRAEMLKVVVQDAAEVGEVVQEIQDRLGEMEHEHGALKDQTDKTLKSYKVMLEAYDTLGEIGERLADYMAAEEHFRVSWEMEKEVVFGKISEMKELQSFYERYSGAYDGLLLEVERRRGVDDRVRAIWRKAQESVDKLLDADQTARETFRNDVGEYLPTDLWSGMQGSARRYEVVPVKEAAKSTTKGTSDSAPAPPTKSR